MYTNRYACSRTLFLSGSGTLTATPVLAREKKDRRTETTRVTIRSGKKKTKELAHVIRMAMGIGRPKLD